MYISNMIQIIGLCDFASVQTCRASQTQIISNLEEKFKFVFREVGYLSLPCMC